MENLRTLTEDGIIKLLETGYKINQEEAMEIFLRCLRELVITKNRVKELESFVMKLSDEEVKEFTNVRDRVSRLETVKSTGGKSFLDQ